MKKLRRNIKKIGQVTIRSIGNKFIVCISGNPKKIENTIRKAEALANKIRKKQGKRLKG